MPGLSISAQNCNSLNVSTIKNQDLKISALAGYKSDIILLSDVRLNGKDQMINAKIRLWYKMYFNSTKNSRGVAILISNQVEHEVFDTVVDPQENRILLKIKIKQSEIVLGSVYGPNLDLGCEAFYEKISETLNRWRGIPCIIGGDWNATPSNLPLNENPDVLFMRNIICVFL